jgi:2,3-bisphosphoglycerate-independent phosphoglycerate mutase
MSKALLIILDGYGEGKDAPYNAVTRSKTPFIDQLRKNYPTTTLRTEGEFVGLPKGNMGGSEVGHYTMGAGKVVWQSLELINRTIKDKSFFKLKYIKKAAESCRKKDSKLHLIGMISDEGVHSQIDHLFALLQFAKKEKLKKVYIHAITDGRDVPERSAEKFIKMLNKEISRLGLGKVATVIGRYYAMDRDFNYERTQKAYDLYTEMNGTREKSLMEAVKNEYKRGTETDYYINPIVLDEDGVIKKEDSVIFFNFRTDRAKQLTELFTTKLKPYFVCFGPYSKTAPVQFKAPKTDKNLGETLSKKGLKQLRLTEGEKFAHVTFFFNSQVKKPYKGEKRIMIQSKKVATYADAPEMSANEITTELIKNLNKKQKFDFVLVNFPNGDVVGHGGDFKPVVIALETLDKCLSKIVPEAQKNGYDIMITADHGNCEEMKYPNGDEHPAHSTNPVICIYIPSTSDKINLRKGKKLGLENIAPTILDILKVKKPRVMTGESLIKHQ